MKLLEQYKTNRDGIVEVISSDKDKVLVRFINTGYERWVDIQNLRAGKCKDHSVDRTPPWEPFEMLVTNNAGSSAKVFAKKGKKVLLCYEKTGHVAECYIDNVKAGKFKDPYEKSFLGIGYSGEFEKITYWRQARQLWQNMMKRCYNPKDEKGYYGRAFVDERWHCFANFLQDLKELENFDAWLLGHEEDSVKYNLDKDFILKGNNIYSKDLCLFLTESENKGLGKRNKTLDKTTLKWVDKE